MLRTLELGLNSGLAGLCVYADPLMPGSRSGIPKALHQAGLALCDGLGSPIQSDGMPFIKQLQSVFILLEFDHAHTGCGIIHILADHPTFVYHEIRNVSVAREASGLEGALDGFLPAPPSIWVGGILSQGLICELPSLVMLTKLQVFVSQCMCRHQCMCLTATHPKATGRDQACIGKGGRRGGGGGDDPSDSVPKRSQKRLPLVKLASVYTRFTFGCTRFTLDFV